jgi:hypothetical protein
MQKKVYQKKKEKKKIIVIFQNRKFELDFVGRQEESPYLEVLVLLLQCLYNL